MSLGGASSVPQVLVAALLEQWGVSGFEAYVRRLQGVYCRKGRLLADALRRHCGDAVSIHWPAGGMFLWVTVPTIEEAEDLLPDMVKHQVRLHPSHSLPPPRPDFGPLPPLTSICCISRHR